MIEIKGVHATIDGNILDVTEEVGHMIFHLFEFCNEYPGESSDAAKQMLEHMIIQTTILAGCNDIKKCTDLMSKDINFMKTFDEMVDPIHQSIDLIRVYMNHLGEEE